MPNTHTQIHTHFLICDWHQQMKHLCTLNDIAEVAVVGAVVQQAVPAVRPGRTLSNNQSEHSQKTVLIPTGLMLPACVTCLYVAAEGRVRGHHGEVDALLLSNPWGVVGLNKGRIHWSELG